MSGMMLPQHLFPSTTGPSQLPHDNGHLCHPTHTEGAQPSTTVKPTAAWWVISMMLKLYILSDGRLQPLGYSLGKQKHLDGRRPLPAECAMSPGLPTPS